MAKQGVASYPGHLRLLHLGNSLGQRFLLEQNGTDVLQTADISSVGECVTHINFSNRLPVSKSYQLKSELNSNSDLTTQTLHSITVIVSGHYHKASFIVHLVFFSTV